jgi:3-hydroxyacyl-CoA dehydrogenase
MQDINGKHPNLIEEEFELEIDRRGGAANLILAAMMLEAGRMLDDGFAGSEIEAAAKKSFEVQHGFLERIDQFGQEKVAAYLSYLSEPDMAGNPLYPKFNNFFLPGPSFSVQRKELYYKGDKPAEDFLLQDMLGRRFQAVLFMVAVDLFESEVLPLDRIDRLCCQTLGWREGPFAMMNRLGIGECMRIVTERMQISHRKEINFPIPKKLIEKAQQNAPWPLNSKLPGGKYRC